MAVESLGQLLGLPVRNQSRMRGGNGCRRGLRFWGGRLGKPLAEAIIAEARLIGYAVMRLDTVPKLAAATRRDESLGFARRDAYYETPVVETIFMEQML
jgi:hypothetical protein